MSKKDRFRLSDAEVRALQDDCITSHEAAILLGWTERNLRRHLHELPSVKRGRQRWFFRTPLLRYKFNLD